MRSAAEHIKVGGAFCPLSTRFGHGRPIAVTAKWSQSALMVRTFRWPIIFAAALAGCATPSAYSDEQRFSGWMMFRGEVMLFSTRQDYLDANNRRGWCNAEGQCESRIHCISGVLAGAQRNLRAWDGQRVIVTGRVVNYESLPDDGEPILPRKLLAGKVVPNFCLRKDVMLIKTVKRA